MAQPAFTDENGDKVTHLPDVLRDAAAQFEELPAWRQWLARVVSGRDWPYALRAWAFTEDGREFPCVDGGRCLMPECPHCRGTVDGPWSP